MRVNSINLYGDWVATVKIELQNKGYAFSDADPEKISIQYFNYLKRMVPKKSRIIKKSDVFNCPPELTSGLALLEGKLKAGHCIQAHLSRKVKNLDEIDDLLYDWGIFHFHLGTELESDGYINRTGPLLFAIFDNLNFYFLNVMAHGSWTRQEMLKTIHRNWPETIEPYRIKNTNVIGLERNVTDDEISQLRKANINVLIEVEPKVIYVTPGGGFVASGHSLEVIRRQMDNKEQLEQLENEILSNPERIIRSAYGDNLSFLTNEQLDFKLEKKNGKYYLLEENNDLRIDLAFGV